MRRVTRHYKGHTAFQKGVRRVLPMEIDDEGGPHWGHTYSYDVITPSLSRSASSFSQSSGSAPASMNVISPWQDNLSYEEQAVEEMVLEAISENMMPMDGQSVQESDDVSEARSSRATPSHIQYGYNMSAKNSSTEDSSTEDSSTDGEKTPTDSMYSQKDKRRKRNGDEGREGWEGEPQPKKTYHDVVQVSNPGVVQQ